jgi:hypothetical protein
VGLLQCRYFERQTLCEADIAGEDSAGRVTESDEPVYLLNETIQLGTPMGCKAAMRHEIIDLQLGRALK